MGACLLGVLVVVSLAVATWWAERDERKRMELILSKHTDDEVKGWRLSLLEKERLRTDQEALEKWKQNYGPRPPSGSP